MRAYELVELSALIAVNGRAFIQGHTRLPDSCIAQYWSVSRSRFDRWASVLRRNLKRLQSGAKDPAGIWPHARPVLEEILTGELLTRVWTAVACAHDQQAGASYVSPVVRSVFLGQAEAHHRALHFLVQAQDYDRDAVLEINQLRRWSERWTDLLLAYLVPVCDVAHVACDPKRVADFAVDAGDQLQQAHLEQVWHLLRLALRSTFDRRLARRSLNGDLNSQIAASILGCLPGNRFAASTTLDSLWMQRMEAAAASAESLIAELLSAESLS